MDWSVTTSQSVAVAVRIVREILFPEISVNIESSHVVIPRLVHELRSIDVRKLHESNTPSPNVVASGKFAVVIEVFANPNCPIDVTLGKETDANDEQLTNR